MSKDTSVYTTKIPELTIEQQFNIAKVKQQIENCSAEQLRELFGELYVVNVKKDSIIKSLLAEKLGIDVH